MKVFEINVEELYKNTGICSIHERSKVWNELYNIVDNICFNELCNDEYEIRVNFNNIYVDSIPRSHPLFIGLGMSFNIRFIIKNYNTLILDVVAAIEIVTGRKMFDIISNSKISVDEKIYEDPLDNILLQSKKELNGVIYFDFSIIFGNNLEAKDIKKLRGIFEKIINNYSCNSIIDLNNLKYIAHYPDLLDVFCDLKRYYNIDIYTRDKIVNDYINFSLMGGFATGNEREKMIEEILSNSSYYGRLYFIRLTSKNLSSEKKLWKIKERFLKLSGGLYIKDSLGYSPKNYDNIKIVQNYCYAKILEIKNNFILIAVYERDDIMEADISRYRVLEIPVDIFGVIPYLPGFSYEFNPIPLEILNNIGIFYDNVNNLEENIIENGGYFDEYEY